MSSARWRPWGAAVRAVTTGPWTCLKRCVKERGDCLEVFYADEVADAALEIGNV